MAEHYNKPIMKRRRKVLRRNFSKAEVIMWKHLSHRQIHGCKFRRQYSVDQYVIDFYCPEFKLAIEVDGDSHFMSGAEDHDKARQEYIESFGIQFLPASPAGGRFTNEDICKNIDGVCREIFEKIEVQKEIDKLFSKVEKESD